MSRAPAIPGTSLTAGAWVLEDVQSCLWWCMSGKYTSRKDNWWQCYKQIDNSLFEKLVRNLWSAKSDGAQFPRFNHIILMQLLQEVAFFGIIPSGRCMHKAHLRRLEVFALQGHVCQLRPKAWLVWPSLIVGRAWYLIGRRRRQQMWYNLIPCPSHLDL